MKKVLLLSGLMLFISSVLVNAQTSWTFPSAGNVYFNGKVGIGSASSGGKLEVGVPHASNQSEAIRIGSVSGQTGNTGFFGMGMNYRLDATGNPTGSLAVYHNGNQTDAIVCDVWTGKIGIGSASSGAKFEVGVPHTTNQSEAIRIGSISGQTGNNGFFGMGMNYRLDAKGNPTGSLAVYHNGIQTDAIVCDVWTGKIGIGSASSGAQLEVGVPHVVNQSQAIRIGSVSTQTGNAGFFGMGMNYRLDASGNPTGSLAVYHSGIQTDAIFFDVWTGRVGIGTSKLDAGSYLTVRGKISTDDIEVKDIAADYVFEKGYKLNSLEEVEAYINANQHLPGIAPASETAKGVDLGKFNTLLLQKVEELTLYTIQLKKEIDELKNK